MNRVLIIFAVVTQLLVPFAFTQTKPAVDLEGAIAKEQVDGDLKPAIAAYQKIAADNSAPRDVRSKALLHMAGCYEKLGQQAQKVYEQIMRDFADQPAATQARAKLAALRQIDRPAAPVTVTQRKVENLGSNMGPWDTDGRRAIYFDDETKELISTDLARHSKRAIYRAKSDGIAGWFPTKDFSKVAILTNAKSGQLAVLAVINADGSDYREIATLNLSNSNADFYRLSWSWDNRYLLCKEPQGGSSRLIRISALDGQIRVLRVQNDGEIGALGAMTTGAFFSPDGRFIAYRWGNQIDVQPAGDGNPRTVYDESKSTNIHFRLIDWTADGRYLILTSAPTGKQALYLIPITDGNAGGEPLFIRYGDVRAGATTLSGQLIYSSIKPGGQWAVFVSSLDSGGHVGRWEQLPLQLGNRLNPGLAWSGDSSRISYIASNEDAGQTEGKVVHIRDISTGADRAVFREHARSVVCVWALGQPKLFCDAGAQILSLVPDVSPTITRSPSFTEPETWMVDLLAGATQDDRALYISRVSQRGETLLRWDVASGEQTELVQSSLLDYFKVVGNWILRQNDQGQSLEIRPVAGGEWRRLLSFGKDFGQWGVSPDGNWVFYHRVDSEGRHGLFRIATSGGPTERRGDFPTKAMSGDIKISPDGHKMAVAADAYATDDEIWSLVNFVPPAAKQQKSSTPGGPGK